MKSIRLAIWRSSQAGILAPRRAVAKPRALGQDAGHFTIPEEARMSRRRAWGMGLGLVAVLLVSVAVAAPPKDAMVIGLLAEPVTMDPPQITDLNSTRVIKRMFEGLDRKSTRLNSSHS